MTHRLELPHAVSRGPLVQFGRGTALLAMPGSGSVLVDANGVVAVDAPDQDQAEVLVVLGAPAAAASELLAGRFALRASSSCVGDRAVVMTAEAGGGKSATAAALALRGHAVLCDAVAVIHGTPPAVAPRGDTTELWPDTAAALGLPVEDVPPLRAGITKRAYFLPREPSAGALGAVVALDLVNHGHGPAAHSLGGAQAVEVLTSLMWHRWAFADLGCRAAAFSWAVGVARSVPVLRITSPRLPCDPAAVAAFIEELAARGWEQ